MRGFRSSRALSRGILRRRLVVNLGRIVIKFSSVQVEGWSQQNVEPVAVEPREGFRIWIRYEDGAEGEIDLSDVAGKGVFKAWDDREFFESVYVSDLPGHHVG